MSVVIDTNEEEKFTMDYIKKNFKGVSVTRAEYISFMEQHIELVNKTGFWDPDELVGISDEAVEAIDEAHYQFLISKDLVKAEK